MKWKVCNTHCTVHKFWRKCFSSSLLNNKFTFKTCQNKNSTIFCLALVGMDFCFVLFCFVLLFCCCCCCLECPQMTPGSKEIIFSNKDHLLGLVDKRPAPERHTWVWISRSLKIFFKVEAYQTLKKECSCVYANRRLALLSHRWDLSARCRLWLPCQAPGDIGSALGLVGSVSIYCDWVR